MGQYVVENGDKSPSIGTTFILDSLKMVTS